MSRPVPLQFHLLSFEGPDPYSSVGGLAARLTGLSVALAALGHETHLWFVGDPGAPGEEQRDGVHLHRWCQWISAHYRSVAYAGELEKVDDLASSLPPHLVARWLVPQLCEGGRVVVIAEEWQTVPALLHLDRLLSSLQLRDRVSLAWNANSTHGFESIDWRSLCSSAQVTTVSRYMSILMRPRCGGPIVIPSGLSAEMLLAPEREALEACRAGLAGRVVVVKDAADVAGGRWRQAVELLAKLKSQGLRPLMVSTCPSGALGRDTLGLAKRLGLCSASTGLEGAGAGGLSQALSRAEGADLLVLAPPLGAGDRRALLASADVVLANGDHEPCGISGLEAMAVGTLAAVGCSGEDYAVAGQNALVLQSGDPDEFLRFYMPLLAEPSRLQSMVRAGRDTARDYGWPAIIRRNLLPNLVPVGWGHRAAERPALDASDSSRAPRTPGQATLER